MWNESRSPLGWARIGKGFFMKMLLAIDDSKFSEAAVQAVIAHHKLQGLEVQVLHVIEPPVSLMAPEITAYVPPMESVEEANALAAKAAGALRSAGVTVTTAILHGDPKSVILDDAKAWGPDLIVLGSHGRKGLERFLVGSVSEAVLRHAHCSVEIVRLPPK
jgi:nucleotide-binding universal stress UspA family protein